MVSFGDVVDGVKDAADDAKEAVEDVVEGGKEAVDEVTEGAQDVAKEVSEGDVDGAVDEATDTAGDVGDTVSETVENVSSGDRDTGSSSRDSSPEIDRGGSSGGSGGSSPSRNVPTGNDDTTSKKDVRDALGVNERQPEQGLPEDKEKLERAQEFREKNPQIESLTPGVSEAIENKKQVVEARERVESQIEELQDAPTKQERLSEINEKIDRYKDLSSETGKVYDITSLANAREKLKESEGLYRVGEGENAEVVSRDELINDLENRKTGLEKSSEEIDKGFEQITSSEPADKIDVEKRVDEEAESIDFYEDYVDEDSAYTETGNKILEAGNMAAAYGEALVSRQGWDLLTSTIPGGTKPHEVVEERMARSIVLDDIGAETGTGIEIGNADITGREVIDRGLSPVGTAVTLTGASAAAGKTLQGLKSVAPRTGAAAETGLKAVEYAEITRRGYQAGSEFAQGDVEGGAKPLLKLGVEEAAGRAGYKAAVSTADEAAEALDYGSSTVADEVGDQGFRQSNIRTPYGEEPQYVEYAGLKPSDEGINSGNQRVNYYPTSDDLPRTSQRTDFYVSNVDDYTPSSDDILRTTELDRLNRDPDELREVAQEVSQVQGAQNQRSGINRLYETPQKGGAEDEYGDYESLRDFDSSDDSNELMNLNEEAQQQTNLETQDPNQASDEPEQIFIDEEGNVARTREVNQEPQDQEGRRLGSDVYAEEGFRPEEAKYLAEIEDGVNVEDVTETGGLEISVVDRSDLGFTTRYDLSEFRPELGSSRGQLYAQRQGSPARQTLRDADLSGEFDLVGSQDEAMFEPSGQEPDIQRIDQEAAQTAEETSFRVVASSEGLGRVERQRNSDGTGYNVEPYDPVEVEGNNIEPSFRDEVSEIPDEEINPVDSEASGVDERDIVLPGESSEERQIEETAPVERERAFGREEQVPRFEQEEAQDFRVDLRQDLRQVGFRAFRPEAQRMDFPGFRDQDFVTDEPGRPRGRARFDLGGDFDAEFSRRAQNNDFSRATEDDFQFRPDLVSANTSEFLFGSATFDVSEDALREIQEQSDSLGALVRIQTVEQEENADFENPDDDFEVKF